MRRSCLLLGLIASAAADDVAQLSRSVEKDLSLESREPTEISHSLDTRFASVNTGRRVKNLQHKRDDDDDDDEEEQKERWEYFHHIADEEEEEEDDDDDDHDSPVGPVGPNGPDGPGASEYHPINGGAIAGAVVGSVIAAILILAMWYFFRIRPKRKQQQEMQAAEKRDDIERAYTGSPSPSVRLPTPSASSVSESQNAPEHVRWAPTPFPGRAPSVQTESTMSGLALPTPALTYSPTITTAGTTPNLPPTPYGSASEKPPAYAAIAALQSSEPQPEASAYQMGHVPVSCELPMYQLPSIPQPVAMDMKGEPISRY
ncbi:hypothetical protein F4677DRAFT_400149 [Hypoxylon crocopeplum]|nr:hypothetical protein F4677DRAFT_400149 [Hypoxylon crocopeplum]